MGFLMLDGLRERVTAAHGIAGECWVDALPGRVAALERDWSIITLPPFSGGCTCSWVAPVGFPDGSSAVLKINFPEPESRYEGEALEQMGGRGAVRLLRRSDDGLALLMERCIPGTDLWSLDVDAGNAVGAGILERIWSEAAPRTPFVTLSELVAEWRETIPREACNGGYEPELAAAAVEMADRLEASQPRRVLLHGDFHPSNVLSAARESWLAIDPKPLVGDPAYDLAQWIGNRTGTDPAEPVVEICRQIEQISRRLDLDSARVAGWAFVKSLGWDWGPAVARVLFAVTKEIDDTGHSISSGHAGWAGAAAGESGDPPIQDAEDGSAPGLPGVL